MTISLLLLPPFPILWLRSKQQPWWDPEGMPVNLQRVRYMAIAVFVADRSARRAFRRRRHLDESTISSPFLLPRHLVKKDLVTCSSPRNLQSSILFCFIWLLRRQEPCQVRGEWKSQLEKCGRGLLTWLFLELDTIFLSQCKVQINHPSIP